MKLKILIRICLVLALVQSIATNAYSIHISENELNEKINKLSQEYEQLDSDGSNLVKEFDALIDQGITGKKLFSTKTYSNLHAVYFDKEEVLHSIEVLKLFQKLGGLPEGLEEIDISNAMNKKSGYKKKNGTELKANIKKMLSAFKINSDLKIEPSPGAKGNIVGNGFPEGTWALTFDDGPSPVHTPKVISNLKETGLKATFFVLARNLSAYPEMAKLEKESGMGLANHSYTHPQLTKLGTKALDYEIRQSTEKETEIWGVRPKFFRCPYGSGTNVTSVRQKIADEKMIHVFWNVDTLDWQDKNPETVYLRAIKQMKAEGKGVILFHDIHPQSVTASKKVMQYINDQKLRAATLQEIVDEINSKTK